MSGEELKEVRRKNAAKWYVQHKEQKLKQSAEQYEKNKDRARGRIPGFTVCKDCRTCPKFSCRHNHNENRV